MQAYDIHKAGGLIISDRKVLACRSRGKEVFVQPGGKLESEEGPVESLIRELAEEQSIKVRGSDLEFVGTYFADAAGQIDLAVVRIDAYLVNNYKGKITPSSEVEENIWINCLDIGSIQLGSIFEHDILPELRKRGLID